MTEEQIKSLLANGFNPKSVPVYRSLWKSVFNKEPQGCACHNQKIYQDLKDHYKIK